MVMRLRETDRDRHTERKADTQTERANEREDIQVWCHILGVPVLVKLKQEDNYEFEGNLSYIGKQTIYSIILFVCRE